MTLLEYILKKDSINHKYLFKVFGKNILTLTITTFIIFSISSIYAYQKITRQLDVKIFYEQNRNINILNYKYRTVMNNDDNLRKFMNDFLNDFYKSFSNGLENNFKNLELVNKTHNKKQFYFQISLHLLNAPKLDQKKLINNEFELIFDKILSKEANNYLTALDIDYEVLIESIRLRKIVISQIDKINLIFILISIFLISLIISVLFIFFKKYK
jgi:hypothetical protein